MNREHLLKRSSLGKVAFIGEVYDVRSESLSSISLLRSDFPKELVRSTDTHQTEFQYKFTENSSDRFELFDVEAELQVSFLFGLIKVDGSGKFLSEEKKSRKTISCSLKCQIQTKNEKLFASTEDYIKHVDLRVLEDPKYTHVITEINWGANCLLNLEFTCDSDSNRENIKGQLPGEFSKIKLISLKGGGQLDKKDSSILNGKDVKIKVFADVVPEAGWPTTVESFFEFVAAVPDLLAKVNNGKGKPLSYTMIPLSGIRKKAKLEMAMDVIVQKIDESFLMSTIYFLQEVEEMKQKLHDLCDLLNEMKQYVKEDYMKTAGRMKAQLALQESEFKSLISQDWVSVRSGEKTLKDLIKRMEQFKYQKLRLYTYEEYLESCSTIVDKLMSVSVFTSKGILYFGRGDNLAIVQSKHPTSEFMVLVTSSEMQKADPELHRKTLSYFLVLATEAKPETKYAIIDFDFADKEAFSGEKPTVTKCFHLRGTEFITRDLFRDYVDEIEGNFVRPMSRASVALSQHKPGNRVILKISCPGFKFSKCSSDTVEWKCYSCRSDVEYGFDNFYYCSCGKTPVDSFEYRCGNPKTHGNSFLPADEEFLKQALSLLRPLEEMNVLVIGQSGVGKSTWINSITNYLSYKTFDRARDEGVICTIPAEMTIFDPKTYKKHVIRVGDMNDNEVTTAGHSATQRAVTYTFLWEGRCVRIIDTPGLGDTRGIDQDKANLRNIIEHIGYLNELHGVCILLKANDNRFNVIFTYCIKELLVNLHKSVTKNIVFCFTNSRTTVYSPGQSFTVLQKVIRDLGIEKELGLGKHNTFCLDNETFSFLCSLNYTDIEYEEVIKESFVKSWDVSCTETERLFDTIKTFQPHELKETLSLVKARSRVIALTKPIAEMSKTIQMNVAVMEKKRKEIESSDLTIEELQKKLTFTAIQLQPVDLNYPRTVCTSSGCVVYHRYQGADVTDIEYKTHCHKRCYLKNVTPKTVNNALLRDCAAMNSEGYCNVCGCSWSNHMHVTYEQKRIEVTMENKFIKEDILREESEKKRIERVVEEMKAEIDKYKQEQDIIIETSVKFGMFLKENAITVYNDSIAEYLEYLIDEEKKKPHKSTTDKQVIQNLYDTLNNYHAEVQVLNEVMKKDIKEGQNTQITPDEVHRLEKQLYSLELTGKQIRQSVEMSRSSSTAVQAYMEVPVSISGNRKKYKVKVQKITQPESTSPEEVGGTQQSFFQSVYSEVEMEEENQLKRSSLGKTAFIGEVYDVRSESLSSISLLAYEYPRELVRSIDTHQTEFQYKFTENSSDRFELLDVEAELQVNYLIGLITGEGSGKFLSDEKKSRKTISCSLKCQIHTKKEELITSTEDYIKHVDLRVLEDPKYTHVITEINWGANCLLNLEVTCDSERNKKDIKRQLATELSKLKMIWVQDGGRLEKKDFSILSGRDVTIKVFADVVPEAVWPTTVESFFEFVAAVPDLLAKVNDGKGKPLSYTMIPLSGIRKKAKLDVAVVVQKIERSFCMSTVYVLQEVEEVKQKLNDLCEFLNEMNEYTKEDYLKTAERMQAQLALQESEFKSLISQDWVSVGSGEKTLKELIKRMEQFKYQKLRLYTYEDYLESCFSIVDKLTSIRDFLSKGILYFGRGKKFATLQSEHPTSEFIVLVTSSEMQKADPELHTRTLSYFVVLAAEAKPETKYAIIDFDFADKEAFPGEKSTVTKCFHLKGTEFLSRDLFQEYLNKTAYVLAPSLRPLVGEETQNSSKTNENKL